MILKSTGGRTGPPPIWLGQIRSQLYIPAGVTRSYRSVHAVTWCQLIKQQWIL